MPRDAPFCDDRIRAADIHPQLPQWLAQLHAKGRASSAINARRFASDLRGLPAKWSRRIVAATVQRLLSESDDLPAWRAYHDLLGRLPNGKTRLDVDEDDLRAAAASAARHCWGFAMAFGQTLDAGAFPLALARWIRDQGAPIPRGTSARAMANRAQDPYWWRRQIRRRTARAVEGAAIALGMVHKRADVYVSDESFARRQMQNAMNRAMLEGSTATNAWGQQYTLQELANLNTSARDIRRHELIIRLKGFEAFAARRWHDAQFVTLTCPSRFHAYTMDGKPNENYQAGLTPADAQLYLRGVWARIRAKLAREGVALYGFRIAEPHGDGTPHWHFVLFSDQRIEGEKRREPHPIAPARVRIERAFAHYGLADSPDEPGAAEHRVTCVPIESEKGSATGYAIKYISKNIDGFRVGDWKIDADLAGDETLNLAPRVQAWAATWGIRQFQQIGGPRVGLWREFRRVQDLPQGVEGENLSDAFVSCYYAANRFVDERSADEWGEMQDKRQADFGAFMEALLPRFGMEPGIAIERDEHAEIVKNRYGEDCRPKVLGLTDRYRSWKEHHGLVGRIVESTRLGVIPTFRHEWVIAQNLNRRKPCITSTLRCQPCSSSVPCS